MKNQQFLAFGAWALALALVPSAAHADKPPEAGAAKQPDAKPGKPGDPPGKSGARPSELFGKPDGKADPAAKGEHGKPDAEAAGADKPGADGKPGHGNQGFRNAMRELHERLKTGKLKKEDLKAELAKLHDNAGERSKEHRQELGKRWGSALAMPAAREELKHHARRMAYLNRALLLAQTEVTKDKDKVIERITKLIDKENERHERKMEQLKSAPGTPAASAAATPSAAPAAAAAPAASAASDAKGAAK
jgi:hypothetical protein